MSYTCLCLNVKIFCKTKPSFQQNEDLWKTKYEFFSQKLGQASDAEVKKEHTYLVHKHAVGEWIVNRCLNCGVETHATRQGTSVVLLSPQLQSDLHISERLMQSPEFSKVFNIVLHGQSITISSHDMPDPSSKNYESLQVELTHIQDQVNSFLLQEEEDMEKRIRDFEEDQRAKFQALQSSVQTEKKKMINLVLQAEKQLDTSVPEKNELPNLSAVMSKSSKKPSLTRVKSTPNKRLHSVDEYEQTPDSDVMFLLEGEGQGQDELFYTSEEEEEEETDSRKNSSLSSDRTGRFQKRPLQYSSSVPIMVPRWGMTANKDSGDESDEDPAPSDPEEMAASMQALARSITNDERMIFGDRPRPRLNTGDFHH
ncbi:uncharacterized protein LOC133189954 [Saccostrea echinata]|uniref:uncharacterized protein LOC133189954 n=1 Tax=Saccostrea echinata TaxID=191078 RepID=UPI002A82DAC0|nr:uncharacterized protein LOC133189954 [Saccostrea echinata]XP_061181385.1 uncharacterized protein LOC133189954 [Saccostrea echinata]